MNKELTVNLRCFLHKAPATARLEPAQALKYREPGLGTRLRLSSGSAQAQARALCKKHLKRCAELSTGESLTGCAIFSISCDSESSESSKQVRDFFLPVVI